MRGYNIESGLGNTFNKLDDTINQMAGKMGDGMGLAKQVEQRPWLTIGAALAVGYVVGTLFGGSDDDDYERDRRKRSKRARSNSYASRYSDQTVPSSSFNMPTYTPPTSAGDKQSMPASNPTSGGISYYNYEGSSSNPEAYSSPSAPGAPSTPSMASSSSSSSKSEQSGSQSGIPSMISEQLDTATATATSAVRNFLRDTIRDAVPSMRDQVDELDRRDGRTPSSSTSSTSSTSTPRDVDTQV